MAFQRKSSVRGLINPPIPLSTFNDMVADGRIPPPDTYLGKTPLWADKTVERIKKSFADGMPSRRKHPSDRAAVGEDSPTA